MREVHVLTVFDLEPNSVILFYFIKKKFFFLIFSLRFDVLVDVLVVQLNS